MDFPACTVKNELMDWQMKVDKVMDKLDAAPCGDKAKVLPEITDLQILREELRGRVESLEAECRVAQEEKKWIEGKISYVQRPVIPGCGCWC